MGQSALLPQTDRDRTAADLKGLVRANPGRSPSLRGKYRGGFRRQQYGSLGRGPQERTGDRGIQQRPWVWHHGLCRLAQRQCEHLGRQSRGHSDTVRAALNIAKYTEEDVCNGLADAELMARALPDLDLDHPWDIDVDGAREIALETEAAALAVDKRIVNSRARRSSPSVAVTSTATRTGFVDATWSTRHSSSCSVIAADDDGMQRDYAYTLGRAPSDLSDAAAVGREAGQRTVARLGRRPVRTGTYPVMFDAPTASGLFGHLLSAISGGSLYRKESYLLDSLGRQVTTATITLAEHPRRRQRPRQRRPRRGRRHHPRQGIC